MSTDIDMPALSVVPAEVRNSWLRFRCEQVPVDGGKRTETRVWVVAADSEVVPHGRAVHEGDLLRAIAEMMSEEDIGRPQ